MKAYSAFSITYASLNNYRAVTLEKPFVWIFHILILLLNFLKLIPLIPINSM